MAIGVYNHSMAEKNIPQHFEVFPNNEWVDGTRKNSSESLTPSHNVHHWDAGSGKTLIQLSCVIQAFNNGFVQNITMKSGWLEKGPLLFALIKTSQPKSAGKTDVIFWIKAAITLINAISCTLLVSSVFCCFEEWNDMLQSVVLFIRFVAFLPKCSWVEKNKDVNRI